MQGKKSSGKLKKPNKALSYLRMREILLQETEKIGQEKKKFGSHGLHLEEQQNQQTLVSKTGYSNIKVMEIRKRRMVIIKK